MAVVYLLTDGIIRALVVWESVIDIGDGGLRAVLLVRLAYGLALHTNNGGASSYQ
ncbi:hypothetical protein [Ferruginibacter sp. SUN106]|uniref:hypothetical protein n=1 Tax=Ferruginibacter sp. SUN106 TaxID=2978348 RepID=UPI003D364A09